MNVLRVVDRRRSITDTGVRAALTLPLYVVVSIAFRDVLQQRGLNPIRRMYLHIPGS
jgi:hypothetical protein